MKSNEVYKITNKITNKIYIGITNQGFRCEISPSLV